MKSADNPELGDRESPEGKMLTAAPVVFSAAPFVIWSQKQYGPTAALIAGVTGALDIGGSSAIISTNVPGLQKTKEL